MAGAILANRAATNAFTRITTTYFSDNFVRPNSTTTMGSTASGALPWTALSGTWGINNNQAYTISGPAASNGAVAVDSSQSDGTITATVSVTGADSTTGGVVFRATDNLNYFLFTTAGTLFRQTAGSFSNIGSGPLTLAVGSVITITLAGSTITARHNGVVVVTATSTFNQTATRYGFRTYGTTGVRWSGISHTAVVPAPTFIALTDNGDGTFTSTGAAVADNGDGTLTSTVGLTDNGDGTLTAP